MKKKVKKDSNFFPKLSCEMKSSTRSLSPEKYRQIVLEVVKFNETKSVSFDSKFKAQALEKFVNAYYDHAVKFEKNEIDFLLGHVAVLQLTSSRQWPKAFENSVEDIFSEEPEPLQA